MSTNPCAEIWPRTLTPIHQALEQEFAAQGKSLPRVTPNLDDWSYLGTMPPPTPHAQEGHLVSDTQATDVVPDGLPPEFDLDYAAGRALARMAAEGTLATRRDNTPEQPLGATETPL